VTGPRSFEINFPPSIRGRLKDIEDLLRLHKYKPTKTGLLQISEDLTLGSPRAGAGERGRTPRRTSKKGGGGSRSGDLYTLFLAEENGVTEENVRNRLDDINVQWVPESEIGALDRAASYIAETNTLLINQDFRVFTEFIAHWEKQYKSVPSAKAIITEVAREWFQQTLTEVIYSVDYLRGDKQWSDQDVAAVLCPEALTAAVLPRYHIEMSVRRALGSKLGSVKEKAAIA
jgi:hypothetical protein